MAHLINLLEKVVSQLGARRSPAVLHTCSSLTSLFSLCPQHKIETQSALAELHSLSSCVPLPPPHDASPFLSICFARRFLLITAHSDRGGGAAETRERRRGREQKVGQVVRGLGARLDGLLLSRPPDSTYITCAVIKTPGLGPRGGALSSKLPCPLFISRYSWCC